MSASVWFEEVSAGLLNELKSTVRIKDKDGALIALPKPEKAFTVRKPEEDFKFEVFPCVSIYGKSSSHDPMRYDWQRKVMAQDRVTHRTVVEDQAVPYNLDFQIDFWSKYQSDMDVMTRTWLMRHFRDFNLSVVDDGGHPRLVYVHAVGNIYKSDLVVNKERLFHQIANYSIWVEIDDEMQYNVPMVTEVEIETVQM